MSSKHWKFQYLESGARTSINSAGATLPEEEISYILAPQTHVHAVVNMMTRLPSAFLEHAGLFTKRPTHRKTGMSSSRTDIYGLSTSGTPRTGCQIRTCTTKLDGRSPIALRVDVLKFLNEKSDIQLDILGFQCSSAGGGRLSRCRYNEKRGESDIKGNNMVDLPSSTTVKK